MATFTEVIRLSNPKELIELHLPLQQINIINSNRNQNVFKISNFTKVEKQISNKHKLKTNKKNCNANKNSKVNVDKEFASHSKLIKMDLLQSKKSKKYCTGEIQ